MQTKNDSSVESSKSGKSITRFDTCLCFAVRKSLIPSDKICWFCRYADFDMTSDTLPETGICRYPDIQIL